MAKLAKAIAKPLRPSGNLFIKQEQQERFGEDLATSIDRICGSSSNSLCISLIQRCIQARDLAQGRRLHKQLHKAGLLERQGDPVLSSLLVRMYGRCGSISDAEKVFNSMPVHSPFSWIYLFGAYCNNDLPRKTLRTGMRMDLEGIPMSKYNLVSSVSACARLGTEFLAAGRGFHQRLVQSGVQVDEISGAALIGMYGKCGSLAEARAVFDSIDTKRIVFWTAMISAYAQQGHGREALDLYKKLVEILEEPPDPVLLLSAITACTAIGSVEEGKLVHEQITSQGLESHTNVGNGLINMYGKCGELDLARQAFDKIETKNLVSWNVIIAAYLQEGQRSQAMQLFRQMDPEGFKADAVTFVHILGSCTGPESASDAREIYRKLALTELESDVFVASALINAFGKSRCLDEAKAAFSRMKNKTTVSMTAMLAVYAQHGLGREALELYKQMDTQGTKADRVTFLSALDACSSIGALAEGQAIHARVVARGIVPDVVLGTALVDMYGRCGKLDIAKSLFDGMKERNTITWNALIRSYVQWGFAKAALELYRVIDVKPNGHTFLPVLTACSMLGALQEGRAAHSRLAGAGFDTEVDVGNAVINMYGKCGSLQDAQKMFEKMEKKSVVTWTTAVAILAHHGLFKQALDLFLDMELEGLKPDQVTMVAVLFACSHSGKLKEGRDYFLYMAEDYGVAPSLVHYDCMVDLLCRSGFLDKAEELIDFMPFEPTEVTWITLLSACKTHSTSYEKAKRAALQASKLQPENPGIYLQLAHMFAGVKTYAQDLAMAQGKLKSLQTVTQLGRCFIETKNNGILELVSGDTDHPFTEAVDDEIKRWNLDLTIDRGCKVEEEAHSAKRAVALGFISTLPGTTIRVVKNVKLCADCHHAIKFYSKFRGREIIIRDYTEFHHFSDGTCSCDDRKPPLGLGMECLTPPTVEDIPGSLF